MNNFLKFKIIFLAILFFAFFGLANGAEADNQNHYVRQGAAGNGSGSDWTNAYGSMPADLTRGDIYYVADGTYPYHVFADAVDGTKYITIKKATISSHGTNTGWQDSYGDGVAEWTPYTGTGPFVWKFKSYYYLIDGVTGGGPGSWATGHGFKMSSTSDIIFIMFSDRWGSPSDRVDVGNITISHVEIDGQGPVAGVGIGFDARALNAHFSNINIDHVYAHDIGGGFFYWFLSTGVTIEYSYFTRNASSNAHHGVGMWMSGAEDFTIRHSVFEDIVGTGFIGGYEYYDFVDNIKIYGNIFRNTSWNLTTNESGCCYGNGILFSVGGSTPQSNWKIYNNSFVNLPNAPVINIYNDAGGNVAYNNIFYHLQFVNPYLAE